jgi:dTDP-glucose pyrophosphorylase
MLAGGTYRKHTLWSKEEPMNSLRMKHRFKEAVPERWKSRFIIRTDSILTALKKMDTLDRKLLIVSDGGVFDGLLSIGDIQRAIINNISIERPIYEILRERVTYVGVEANFEEVKTLMLEYRMELCPVVDGEGVIVNIHFWEDLFNFSVMSPRTRFELPVVIMAGGLGMRLRPLTQVLPKPLIPIGNRSIIEEIIDSFAEHGCRDFHISLNYKAELIRFYLDNLQLPVSLNYHIEEEPLGTGGSLSLMKGEINTSFFVSNCDILISQDYSEIVDYHRDSSNEITLVSAIRQIPIPYGTLETDSEGKLTSILEKPELTFKINTGMYLLEPNLLDEIPEKTFYPITNLIDKLLNEGRRVGVFPISEMSWKDIGEPGLLKQYLASMGYGS